MPAKKQYAGFTLYWRVRKLIHVMMQLEDTVPLSTDGWNSIWNFSWCRESKKYGGIIVAKPSHMFRMSNWAFHELQ